MGCLQSSRLIFYACPSPNSFMFGVLLKCYLWNHLFDQVLSLCHYHIHMGSQLTRDNSFLYPSVLRAASAVGDLVVGRKVHGRVVKNGLSKYQGIGNSLVAMYGESCCLSNARKVFDEMCQRDLVSLNSMVSCYVENGLPREGLEVFHSMASEGIRPDLVTLFSIAKACAKIGCLRLAKSVHGYAIREGMASDASLSNSLIVMYNQCGYLCRAKGLFEYLTDRSTNCWNSMISSYNKNGYFEEALDAFIQMQESAVEPNAVTMISVLNSCNRLGRLREGKSVHCFILRKAMDATDLDLGPALSWNTLISFYAQEGLNEEAMVLFAHMLAKGIMPDSFSLARSISASASAGSIHFGQQIHAHVMKRGVVDVFVQTSLIDMYSKCGFVDLAYTIFNKFTQKNVVTWSCMISGFSQNGNSVEAFKLFNERCT